MLKNISSKIGLHHFLMMAAIIILFLCASCAGSQSTQQSRHRKPVTTGKRKCGCSMLSPALNHTITLYQPTNYVVQA